MTSTYDATSNKCRFCDKTREDVRTLLVSNESAICDECIVAALDTISRTRGQFHLRIAFFVFRAVASLGRLIKRR
jgi:ATP-dependent protease Clp ATPase subunit